MIETRHQNDDVEMGSERGFGIVFAVVFAIIALWPLIHWEVPRLWATAIAVIFFAIALIRPALLRPLNIVWFKFGLLLSKIVTPVIMALVYVTTVVPTGMLLRLKGKNLLGLKRDPDKTSFWVVRDAPGPVPGSMKRQF
jgi:hypothetical protein